MSDEGTAEKKVDDCEVCGGFMPPLDAWSMPTCPDCQQVFDFLGELQADFADREQTHEADLVGKAIDLAARPLGAATPPPAALPRVLDVVEELEKRGDELSCRAARYIRIKLNTLEHTEEAYRALRTKTLTGETQPVETEGSRDAPQG